MWQFVVEVIDDNERHEFLASTSMTWRNFEERALSHINRPREQVTLGYHLNMDPCGMTQLTCENQWDAAQICVREKCLVAQTRAVMMEVRNLVSILL